MSIEVGGTPGKGSLTNLACRNMLAAACVSPQIFNAPALRLYTAGPDPVPGMILADFTEALNITPAHVTAVTFGTPTWEDDYAQMVAVASANSFTYDGSGDAPTILGWMLTDGVTTTANVLYAEKLDTPKTLDATTESITIIPAIPLLPQQA